MTTIKRNNWLPYRAGFLNYWFFDEQYFKFENGNILFHGDNGKGKSVSMQSIIPLLLDGNKRPNRLDPFGSSARKMIDYLFIDGDEMDVNKIAYLFFEFKKRYDNEFITIGMGLKPKSKNTSEVDSWYFILNKGKRLGKDLSLLKRNGFSSVGEEQFTPLTKKDLKELIEETGSGKFTTSQTEYSEEVNKHIFKYKDFAKFQDLMNLIIQIRTPKLSKDFKPVEISNILQRSLPELSTGDLKNLSSTIKEIDEQSNKIIQLEIEYEGANRLAAVYEAYIEAVLSDRANQLLLAFEEKEKAERTLNRKDKELQNEHVALEKVKKKLNELFIEKQTLQSKISIFENSTIRNLNNDKLTKETIKEDKESLLNHRESKKEERSQEFFQLSRTLNEKEAEFYQLSRELKDLLDDVCHCSDEIELHDHFPYTSAVERLIQEPLSPLDFFGPWVEQINNHRKKIEEILSVIRDEEKYRLELEAAKEQYHELQNELDGTEKEIRNTAQEMDEQKDAIHNQFFDWIKNNSIYRLDSTISYEIAQDILAVHDSLSPHDVENKWRKQFYNLDGEVNRGIHRNKAQQTLIIEEKDKTETEIQKLRTEEEVQPSFRREETVQARFALSDMDVPFVPFYEAVEFLENIPEDERERYESALIEMGVLDSLIVPKDFVHLVSESDSVILPKEIKGHPTLCNVLSPVIPSNEAVEKEDIVSALRSIAIMALDEESFVTSDGEYQAGRIYGHAVKNETSLFIGSEARKRHKEKKIAELEEKRKEQVIMLEQLNQQYDELQQKLDMLQQEYNNRPAFDAVNKLKDLQDSLKKGIKRIEKEKDVAEKKRQNVAQLYQRKRYEKTELTEEFSYAKTEENFRKLFVESDRLKDEIQHLRSRIYEFQALSNKMNTLKTRNNQIQEDIDDLHQEIYTLEREISTLTIEIKDIEAVLIEQGYDKIKKEVEAARTRLQVVEMKHDELKPKPFLHKNAIERLTEEKHDLDYHLQFLVTFLAAREELLRKELRRQDISVSSPLTETAKTWSRNLEIKQAKNRIRDMYFEVHKNELSNYPSTFQEDSDLINEFTEEQTRKYRDKLQNLSRDTERSHVVITLDGFKKTPIEMREYLKQTYEELRFVLTTEESRVFKELIIENLGEKIIDLIKKAEIWKNDINRIMNSLSSSIKLRLTWSPKTFVQTEDEITTSKLLELLRRDPVTLRDEDYETLTAHFNSKIDRAKESLDRTSNHVTLEDALKSVLDYRKWFQFQIYYELTGEREKLLNKDNFSKLSGGERALSMYIPLFSAAYSKYKEAGEEAPYLIALDEAFAGVDNENISSMFGLMETLDFNYILTSQALWGDYDTVPGLAIADVYLDKAERTFSMIPYIWNGHVKSLDESFIQSEFDISVKEDVHTEEEKEDKKILSLFEELRK
jgi:uncharacterized protein (TIGR02680 family)